ncbi:MAG: rhodanese-like domain-containing protein [Gammaproteobacteria bacterium]|jgi:rhodanese-related sulfurtransferase
MPPLTMNEMVARARSRIREVTAEDLARGLEEDAVLIDVREPEEHAAERIPGSVNIPRGILEAEVEPRPELGGVTAPELQDRDRPIYLYCRSGGRSALAADSLQQMGFSRVASLAGGILAWRANQQKG